MAGLIPRVGGESYYLYARPNPALSEILLGGRVHDLVDEYGLRVESTYVAALQARKHVDDDHPGQMAGSIEGKSFIGGYENDRWVGELVVHVEYALADEYGRSNPSAGQNDSTTPAHHDLRDALYANLPPI
jgi:hypothetical protein